MTRETKTLASVEIKDASKGEVEALFSTLNVKDHDGDVTEPGAFQEGAKVLISAYNHGSWDGSLPVGKGSIGYVGDDVVMKGQFFLNTTHGRDAFETVKALSEDGLQEWSYGFDVEDSAPGEFKGEKVRYLRKLKVYEVSPVLRGAGIGTRTLAVKSAQEEGDGITLTDVEGRYGPAGKRYHYTDEEMAEMVKSGVGRTLNDEISEAVDAAKAAVKSAERVAALRAEKGKELSQINKDCLDELSGVIEELKALLTTEEVIEDKTDYNAELRKSYLASVAANYSEGN